MPPRRSSRSASSSSGKAPATPPLIIVPFAPRQTRSTTKRAIVAAHEAPPVLEYQQTTNILEVSSDFHGTMKFNAAYVADEGGQSSPNETRPRVYTLTANRPLCCFSGSGCAICVDSKVEDEGHFFHLNESPGQPVDFNNLLLARADSHLLLPRDAFSFKFYYAALDFAWEHISTKDFISQRKLLLKDFASTPGLCDILHSAKLFQTVFFGSFDCDADYTEDMDVVTRRLTGGTRKGYVPRAMAVLLFKIASGIQVNLGQLLFDQVVEARNRAKGRKDLILPNLIYSLLVVQGFEKDASEFYEAEPKLIKADHRLLTGTHIDDLARPNDNAGPSSTVDTTSVTVAFLENEFRFIHDHRQMLSTREARITGLLSTLRQNTHDGDSPDCEVASSYDESVAF
nr:acidic leucine-rich nuclear phosphoprotein 32 family member A-like [Ipomoea batatas]